MQAPYVSCYVNISLEMEKVRSETGSADTFQIYWYWPKLIFRACFWMWDTSSFCWYSKHKVAIEVSQYSSVVERNEWEFFLLFQSNYSKIISISTWRWTWDLGALTKWDMYYFYIMMTTALNYVSCTLLQYFDDLYYWPCRCIVWSHASVFQNKLTWGRCHEVIWSPCPSLFNRSSRKTIIPCQLGWSLCVTLCKDKHQLN